MLDMLSMMEYFGRMSNTAPNQTGVDEKIVAGIKTGDLTIDFGDFSQTFVRVFPVTEHGQSLLGKYVASVDFRKSAFIGCGI